MADFTKFRSSMGGFKRSDVTNYIESLSAGHRQAMKELQSEKDALSDRLAETMLQLQEKTAALEAAQKQLALAEGEQDPEPDYPSMELEAYRRAEATERLAAERSARLRQRLNDLLNDVSLDYKASGQEIQALSVELDKNLQSLQEILSQMNRLFEETDSRFDTLEAETLPE